MAEDGEGSVPLVVDGGEGLVYLHPQEPADGAVLSFIRGRQPLRRQAEGEVPAVFASGQSLVGPVHVHCRSRLNE